MIVVAWRMYRLNIVSRILYNYGSRSSGSGGCGGGYDASSRLGIVVSWIRLLALKNDAGLNGLAKNVS